MNTLQNIITAHKTKLRESNSFTSVCHSLHGGWGRGGGGQAWQRMMVGGGGGMRGRGLSGRGGWGGGGHA